jgi:hypothetical protein
VAQGRLHLGQRGTPIDAQAVRVTQPVRRHSGTFCIAEADQGVRAVYAYVLG